MTTKTTDPILETLKATSGLAQTAEPLSRLVKFS